MTNNAVDLAVVGAGPAGRALAHRSAALGVRVALVDPHLDAPWQPTYAAWADDLPPWLDPTVIAATCSSISVYTPTRRVLDRRYVTLHTIGFQNSLTLDDVEIHEQSTTQVAHDSVQLSDGTSIRAGAVVDARGLRDGKAPAQTAYGVVVDRAQAAPILGDDNGVLMDWRCTDRDGTPTFLYAIPMDDERVLLEETCLAATPAMPVGDLRQRLRTRLATSGVDADTLDVFHTERVHFALRDTTRLPWHPGRPTRFGAAGGMVHPATGYSVAESLSSVDPLVQAIIDQSDPCRALWPWRARAVYRLRVRGLGALLDLPPADLTGFFDAFFAVSPDTRRAYLSGRHDLAGTLKTMAGTAVHADVGLAGRIIRSATR